MNNSKAFIKRQRKVRNMIKTNSGLRLTVYRSNTHIYAQIIDDSKKTTICSASDVKIKNDKKENKIQRAFLIGEEIGKLAGKKKIKSVVFDRGGYKYHGRIKSLAEGARKAGLIF